MTSIKTIAIAGLLSLMTAAPAFAQAAIQEPGLFAFYYPNLDVLNGGAPTQAYRLQGDSSALQSLNEQESGLAAPRIVHHRHVHRMAQMHDGRRHG